MVRMIEIVQKKTRKKQEKKNENFMEQCKTSHKKPPNFEITQIVNPKNKWDLYHCFMRNGKWRI